MRLFCVTGGKPAAAEPELEGRASRLSAVRCPSSQPSLASSDHLGSRSAKESGKPEASLPKVIFHLKFLCTLLCPRFSYY